MTDRGTKTEKFSKEVEWAKDDRKKTPGVHLYVN